MLTEFKFYHKDEPSLIYNAVVSEEVEDSHDISWDDHNFESGQFIPSGKTDYPSSNVENYVQEGIWIVVE